MIIINYLFETRSEFLKLQIAVQTLYLTAFYFFRCFSILTWKKKKKLMEII